MNSGPNSSPSIFFARGAPIDPRSIERRWVGAVGYPSQCQLASTDAKARLELLNQTHERATFRGHSPGVQDSFVALFLKLGE